MPREPIVFSNVVPELECGRYAVKREIGDWLLVWADVFRDGHALLAAALLYNPPGRLLPRETPLEALPNDRWFGSFALDAVGEWSYTLEAWTDRWATWLADTQKKAAAGVSISTDLVEGRALALAAGARATGADAAAIAAAVEAFDGGDADVLFNAALGETIRRHPDRSAAARYEKSLRVRVDRERARFAAWYEFFPRSQGTDPQRHGTFLDAERRIGDIADLGFDVVYLPPIHPIGNAFRKGRNNAPAAMPQDVGSPYAIGSSQGGHCAIHPALGTIEDFDRFVAAVRHRGMEVALDYAIQCSPDHPWIREHPEWFSFRPDGSIQYAENPPKKYQDIVNFNFDTPHARQLWNALRDVVFYWMDHGVRIFRVDNPHTKPLPFWEWLIRQVHEKDAGVIFLAEAFTKPKMMWALAKIGFTESYTYFTWRTTKAELTEYVLELATQTHDFLRPHFFANTPDILHRFLQEGGRPAFRIRLVLAATLSSLYGIYSGFELCENAGVPHTEEYANSEKYELRVRDWNAPGSIRQDVRAINAIRRANPALHEFENVRFYPSNDESVIFYGKMDFFRTNFVFVAVNLDPKSARSPALEFPTGEFGLDPAAISDVYGDTPLRWSQGRAYTVLDPQRNPAAIFVVNA